MKKDKCANCGGMGDVSVSVPCPECRPNAARNATRDRKRAEMFGEMFRELSDALPYLEANLVDVERLLPDQEAQQEIVGIRSQIKAIRMVIAKARELL